jgi:hypothetical protein
VDGCDVRIIRVRAAGHLNKASPGAVVLDHGSFLRLRCAFLVRRRQPYIAAVGREMPIARQSTSREREPPPQRAREAVISNGRARQDVKPPLPTLTLLWKKIVRPARHTQRKRTRSPCKTDSMSAASHKWTCTDIFSVRFTSNPLKMT